MTKLLVVDTETTGLNPDKDLVWQVGAVEIDLVNRWSNSHEFDLPYSRDEYPDTTYRLGHIYETLRSTTDQIYWDLREELEGEYTSKADFLGKLRHRFADHRDDEVEEFSNIYDSADVIVAHNAKFDRPFVERLFPHWITIDEKPWDCTLKMFQSRYPGRRSKLSQACAFFGIEWDVMKEHTALYDAEMCARLLMKMQGIEGIEV